MIGNNQTMAYSEEGRTYDRDIESPATSRTGVPCGGSGKGLPTHAYSEPGDTQHAAANREADSIAGVHRLI